ncbi:MAG: type II toxin-antitoxin system RelE/ParE family toxin [Candidatus Kapaibacterium sp.]
MRPRFRIEFLPAATHFIEALHDDAREKILFTMRKSQYAPDAELFKKLNEHIWEFRTHHRGHSYRLFAFWDTKERHDTIIVVTHGIVKKSTRTPIRDIHRAMSARRRYLNLQ